LANIFKDKSRMKVRIFFEVMGWPAEALTEHLKKAINKLKNNWKITAEHYEKPVPVDEKNPKMLTAHAEFEAEIPSFAELAIFSIVYAPSVVEIIEPSEIYLKASEIQDILADVISKVQGMDKEIKILAAKNRLLENDNKHLRDKLSIKEQERVLTKEEQEKEGNEYHSALDEGQTNSGSHSKKDHVKI